MPGNGPLPKPDADRRRRHAPTSSGSTCRRGTHYAATVDAHPSGLAARDRDVVRRDVGHPDGHPVARRRARHDPPGGPHGQLDCGRGQALRCLQADPFHQVWFINLNFVEPSAVTPRPARRRKGAGTSDPARYAKTAALRRDRKPRARLTPASEAD